MVSARKLAANRRNAKKSTGPRTEKGKRKVSQNALVHGLRSQRWPVLPFEDQSEYQEFADAVVRDLNPSGIVQRELVEQITQTMWKLRRFPAIEEAMLRGQLAKMKQIAQEQFAEDEDVQQMDWEQTTTPMLIAADLVQEHEGAFQRLEIQRARLQRSLHAAMRELRKLREETTGEEIDPKQSAEFEIDHLRLLMQRRSEALAEVEEKTVANKPNEPEAPDNSRPENEKETEETIESDEQSRSAGVQPVPSGAACTNTAREAHTAGHGLETLETRATDNLHLDAIIQGSDKVYPRGSGLGARLIRKE